MPLTYALFALQALDPKQQTTKSKASSNRPWRS
jgi:hypothetical protein